jgi:transglutaminase-like putative cysteine protease
MRLKITHEIQFRFEEPASYAIQTLRMTPRNSDSQFVVDWRIDVSRDCHLAPVDDPFGNLTHTFSLDGPIDELTLVATGEVLTDEMHGVVRGARDRMPHGLFLRATPLTTARSAVKALAEEVARTYPDDALGQLHALNRLVRETIASEFDPVADTSAGKALYEARGDDAALTHVFIAAARTLGCPARFVSGYLYRPEGEAETTAPHAWAEVHLAGGLGWVGFDPTEAVSPTDAYVRVAIGLDGLDASPLRGVRTGGHGETQITRVKVEPIIDRPRGPGRGELMPARLLASDA